VKIPRDLVVGTISSLLAAALVAAMSLVSGIVQGRYTREISVSVRPLLVILYVVLLAGTVFVLVSGRPSQIDPLRRLPRFGRWPKVASVTATILALLPVIWSFVPYSIPPFQIQVRNHGKYGIVIKDQAVFYIKVPESPASNRFVTSGMCQMFWFEPPAQRDKPLLVFPEGTADLKCQMLDPLEYQSFVESGKMEVELSIVDSDGNNSWATMALNNHALESHWMIFEFR
jgi:hypothetical protein